MSAMAKMMLGELLVGAGLVSEEQVLAALRAQRGSGMPLGIYLVRSGVLNETELINVLSQQLEVGIVDLDAVTLQDDAVKKIPPEYARANRVVAFRIIDRLHRQSDVSQQVDSFEDLYRRFLMAAAVMLGLGMLFLHKRSDLAWQTGGVAVAVVLLATLVA